MAKKPVKRTIQGYDFEFFPIPPKQSLKIITRLTKLIAEPLGTVIDQVRPKNGEAERGLLATILAGDIGSDTLSKAMQSFTNRLDESEVIDTVYMLIENVHGKLEGDSGTRSLNPDTDFAGEIGLMLEVAVNSIEVNLGSFLKGRFGGALTRSGTNLAVT